MSHRRLTPIRIGLKELPPEGRDFSYTRASGELNDSLTDLIGKNDYQVRFKITPQGNSFDLRGEIQTTMNLQCALCALDFSHPVQANLHELIVIMKPLGKGDSQSRANHAHEWIDGGPDSLTLISDMFDVAEYVHEMIALQEPIKPLGQPDCEVGCENLKQRVERRWLTYGEEAEKTDGLGANPFQVLEKMKIRS